MWGLPKDGDEGESQGLKLESVSPESRPTQRLRPVQRDPTASECVGVCACACGCVCACVQAVSVPLSVTMVISILIFISITQSVCL